MTTRLLTPAEAAEILGVRQSTLQAWRFKGIGPPYVKLTPKLIRYDYEELMRWVATHHRSKHEEEDNHD